MKTNKQTKTINFNGICKLGLTFCAILLCSSFFIFSINKATANDSKSFNFPEKLTNKDISAINASGGKYQMSLSAINNTSNQTHWYILVWNTETGRSKFYYGNVKEGTLLAPNKYILPSRPL